MSGSLNVLNNHFLSITNAILKSADDANIPSDYKSPASLMRFCKDRISYASSFKRFCKNRISYTSSFKVPPTVVHEAGVYINKLKNKNSNGARQYQFHDVKSRSSSRNRIVDIHLQFTHSVKYISFGSESSQSFSIA